MLFDSIKKEFKNSPIAVSAALIATLSLIANTAYLNDHIQLLQQNKASSDARVLLAICVIILAQGMASLVMTMLQAFFIRLGTGAPMLLVMIAIVAMAWLLSFNAYWFAVVEDFSGVADASIYQMALLISWPFAVYMQIHSFSKSNETMAGHGNFELPLILLISACNLLAGTFMAFYFGQRLSGFMP